ncbi:MAG: Flp pilus assembly protein TadD [Alphaproteobacteria bacterium]|jgi:Flp pilus assembly protein TadD
MKKLNKILITASVVVFGSYSSLSVAQQSVPIVCPGYKQAKTKLLGERSGKKLQKAYEVYLNEELEEKARIQQAITMLREIESKEPFDKATVDRFLGQLLVSEEGKQLESLALLTSAADLGVLNAKDQADLLKLVADLSIQEEKYENSIKYYTKWMEFTCKKDADIYTRMAKAYTELKDYDKVLASADLAIANYEEPNKNPYALKINAYHEKKQYDGAVAVAEVLVELFPAEKNWWSQLGFFYMLTEDYNKALSTFALAYKQGYLSKKSELKALVQLYASSDVPFRSAELHKKYMSSGLLASEATDLASLANTLQLAREYSEAAKYYGQAAVKSGDADYYRKQGVLLLTAEDYKGAIAALTKSMDSGTESVGKVHFSLMEANFYAGNFRKAYSHANEAKKDPGLRRNALAWIPYIKQKAENRGIKI